MSLLRRVLGPPNVQKHLEQRDVAKLIDDLRDQDAGIRASAAEALGKLADVTAVPALIKALEDPEKSVTDAVTAAISAMSSEVIPLLVPVIAEGHTWTRADKGARAAIAAISSREFEKAVSALQKMLHNSEWRVRLVARDALIAQGTAAMPHAISALQDENVEVRKAAAEILGALKGDGAVNALIPMLRDTDVTVREAAVASLGNIGDSRAADPLIDLVRDSADPPRTAAIDALGKLRVAVAVEPLIQAMDGADDRLLGHAAEALRLIHDPAAAAPLRSALEKTTSIDSREVILATLASLRDPAAKGLLLDELRTEEKRLNQAPHLDGRDFQLVKSVIGSLALIGGDDVVAELIERRKSPLSYDVGERGNSERFYPIRDAASSALALLGSRDDMDPAQPDRRQSETKTGRFEVGS
jgi:HEAT repeat protein